MALLDRLRPQPGWKHPDPQTRVSALESLPESEQSLFASLAREDESPRVRRAAVLRLVEVDVLGDVARSDTDPQVRADATARLLAIAANDADAGRRRRAADAVTDERQLAQLVRTAAHEDVALSALERIVEPRALGGVARHALHETVRLAAMSRLDDPAELEAVALHSEHRDSGMAAVERLTDERALEAIAERARNRIVGKRARAIVREYEVRRAETRAAEESRVRRLTQIGEALDLLTRSRDAARGRAELARLVDEWQAAGEAPAEAQARFEWLRSRAAEHFDTVEREDAAARAARAAREAAIADRRRVIAQAAALDAEDAAAADEATIAWQALPALDGPEAAGLEREFRAAIARVRDRQAARERLSALRGDLERIAAEAGVVVDEPDLNAARTRWTEITRRWREASEGLALDRELYDRFHTAEARWLAREEGVRAQKAREASENHARLRSLCDRATALTAMPEASLRDLDHAVRDLRAAADHLGPLPSPELQETLAARVKTLLAELLPRLRELRETDDWRRWANAGIQEELCKRVEALRAVADPQEAAPQLRDLRRQWKAVSGGPREGSNALWERFRAAADEVQARCDAYFSKIAAEHAQHLVVKQAIVDRAEALAQSTDWIATADTLKRLQTEWNATGPVSKEHGADLARRFRAACDTFFTRRKTDLVERKQVWAGNAQRKEALCARAEALATSTEWAAAVAEIKQLQAEWKTVGPVRKNRSEALWKRFRAACDAFFERYGKRHELEHAHRQQEREAACLALETLVAPAAPPPAAPAAEPSSEPQPESVVSTEEAAAPSPAAEEPAAPALPADRLVAALDATWKRWHDAPGLPPEAMQALRTRFDAALGAVLSVHRDALKGTRFDREANVARRTALCEEAEAILKGAGRQAEMASSGASLAALLKESLAANTIGGRVNEETKLRAAADRLRRAQSAWRDAGPVPGEEGRTLDARFQRANRRFFDLHPELRHHGPSAGHHGPPPQGHGRPGPPHRDRHPRPPRPPDGRKA